MNTLPLIPRAYHHAQRLTPLFDLLRDALLLCFRLYLAWVFLRSGLAKLDDWDNTLFLFQEEFQVPLLPPALAAIAGTLGEIALPPLLALGLAGRFAAAGLFVVNAMAVVSYPALWTFECPAALQSHVFWGAGLLTLLACDGGRLALDPLLARRLQAQYAPSARPTHGPM